MIRKARKITWKKNGRGEGTVNANIFIMGKFLQTILKVAFT